jgi:hypothetical protein
MKRALSIIGVIGVTAAITYLAITRQMAQERASRLDRALMDAEARVIQLEADIEAAKQRLTELTEARQVSRLPAPPPRRAPATAVSEMPRTPPAANVVTTGASPLAGAPEVVTVIPVAASGSFIRYAAFSRPGLTNFVRIEGTSTIHDWQVEGRLIGGSVELGTELPTQPGARAVAGTMDAKVNAFIPVRSLKSVEKDGSAYSSPMDEIMYRKLLEQSYKRITFTLTSLTLKEEPRSITEGSIYEATGKLAVAGVTNAITMPVTVLPDVAGRIQFAGSVKVKMTDFKITPPSPTFGGVSIKTGDEVTLRFAWWVNRVNTGEAGQ